MAEEKKSLKVTIDNITVEVKPGTTILEAARMIGGDVTPPAMCYYSKLKGSGGKCRTCLVEVAAGSSADPRPMPKLVASCRTGVMDGMIVKNITSDKVLDARAGVTEALHVLEEKHLIRTSRGRILVTNRGGLKQAARGLYGTPEAEYYRLTGVPIETFGKIGRAHV